MKLTAVELKATHPKEFERQYWEWVRFIDGLDWWDWVKMDFVETCKPLGIRVDDIYLYFNERTAVFSGRVNVAEWMKSQKLDEKWFPLYVAFAEDCSYVDVGHNSLVWHCSLPYGPPTGIFSDMCQEEWEDMLDRMLREFDYDALLQEFLNNLCGNLSDMLERAYQDETSEERFMDDCEANEVTFEVDDDEICD